MILKLILLGLVVALWVAHAWHKSSDVIDNIQ